MWLALTVLGSALAGMVGTVAAGLGLVTATGLIAPLGWFGGHVGIGYVRAM